jgi:hypothetical protein
MGSYFSYIYVDNLIGITISEANQYIINNKVYFDQNNTYRVTEIKVSGWGLSNTDYNFNRLNVKTDENGKIVKILYMG